MNIKRKVLSIFLCVMLLCNLAISTAFAADPTAITYDVKSYVQYCLHDTDNHLRIRALKSLIIKFLFLIDTRGVCFLCYIVSVVQATILIVFLI